MQQRLAIELRSLQSACPHTNKTGKYAANTGNWCPQDDDYWISVHCPDCTKQWTIFHSEEPDEYKNFDGERVR